MAANYICDVCTFAVTAKDGVLHSVEMSHMGDELECFAFHRWNDDAAKKEDFGHVHKRCIPTQAAKYLEKYNWGWIERIGGSKIVGRAKANRIGISSEIGMKA